MNGIHLSDVVVEVGSDSTGERLDKYLASKLDATSRSRIQDLIRSGCVTTALETVLDVGRRVKRGEVFTVRVPSPVPAAPGPEPIPLTVVYEDQHLIVIDKPPGLVVHPAAGHATGTLVNALLAHCGDSLSGIGGERRPGIVHRLDKDTSGLLVVAKTDVAHRGLADQFAAHGRDGRLQRQYLAFAWGVPILRRGTIDVPLGRSTTDRKKIAVVTGRLGRAAVTDYEVLETYSSKGRASIASLLRLGLQTGRTHQIRVHLAHAGHPVLGDATYGSGYKTSASLLSSSAQQALIDLNRQALHAAILGFEHPATGQGFRFESPMPDDMAQLHRALARNEGD